MTDILAARRNGSDICWIFKDYESKISFFSNYKSKEMIRKLVLNSSEFKYEIKLLSDKLGKNEEDFLLEAERILSDMSHNIGMHSIRFMGVTLSKIMKKLYKHVYINYGGVIKLRETFKDSNVVLLPTHRSYADFLLVSYVMFCFNLPMPVIAAAMDFMNMKFVGELLRSCGAFFIRRSFVDDDLYWAVFSHYIKTLIKISQESLEFFIEGTRSRTNKSLYPKIGMLGILLEMWLSTSRDIKIIPIGISYDRLLEETLYAWELFGVPKPKESTSGLLKVRHILNENYGDVYFNIGDPISISDLADQFGVKRTDHNLQLRFRPLLFENEKCFLRQLSKIVVESQQKNYIISDWSVIVLILMSHTNLRPLSLAELHHFFMQMITLLATFDVKLSAGSGTNIISLTVDNATERIKNALEVHYGLVTIEDRGVTLRAKVDIEILKKNVSRCNSIIVDQIHLGIYRNPLLFHVARESLLLNRIRLNNSGDQQAIFEDFSVVFELFSREFVFAGTVQHNFDTSMAKLRRAQLLVENGTVNESHNCLHIIEGVITPHVLAYIIYGHVFLNKIVPKMSLTKAAEQVKVLQNVAMTLCRTHDWLAQNYLEICSLDIARNALAQMTEILKRKSLADTKTMLSVLNNFLSLEVNSRIEKTLRSVTAEFGDIKL